MPSDFILRINPDEATRDVRGLMAEKIPPIANRSLELAQQNSPVQTGYHRDHMTVETQEDGGFVLQSNDGYGGYLEIGTVHMAAQPHMVPAVEQAFAEARG